MNMETAVTVLVFTCLVVTGCSVIHLFNLKAHVKWTENIFLFKLYFKIYLKLKLFFLKMLLRFQNITVCVTVFQNLSKNVYKKSYLKNYAQVYLEQKLLQTQRMVTPNVDLI